MKQAFAVGMSIKELGKENSSVYVKIGNGISENEEFSGSDYRVISVNIENKLWNRLIGELMMLERVRYSSLLVGNIRGSVLEESK